MSQLENYKGLEIVEPDPLGEGGLAINNDLKALVDWNPKCEIDATTDPTSSDGEENDFHVGSLWRNSTTGAMFVCVVDDESAAIWRPIPIGDLGLAAWNTTTNSTPTPLYLNGVDEPIEVPVNSVWAFTISAVGRRGRSASAYWEVKGAIKRGSTGGAVLIGSPTTESWKGFGTSAWNLTAAATGNNLQINATGSSTLPVSTIDWLAFVRITAVK